MPIYQLTDNISFPHPSHAEDGILAIGGDLSVDRLLLAYRHGIFPWYNEGDPIIWHAPSDRFVLFPKDIKVSKTMDQLVRNEKYRITIDQNFEQVIVNCKDVDRKGQDGTWIVDDMMSAYIELYKKGYAHSVEVWDKNNELKGGLYGINIGTVFYGESMFSLASNTSKLALIYLARAYDFSMIDCQIYTAHLESMGAVSINLESFLTILDKECQKTSILAKK